MCALPNEVLQSHNGDDGNEKADEEDSADADFTLPCDVQLEQAVDLLIVSLLRALRGTYKLTGRKKMSTS